MTILNQLTQAQDLTREDSQSVIDAMLHGELGPASMGAILAAWTTKGFTGQELAGAALALRGRMVRVPHEHTTLLDNCGTGGATYKTANVSTAAAMALAGSGIPVAKHGNRSFTRPSGSADLLERSGYPLDLSPKQLSRLLREAGLAFLFAPNHHPSLASVGPIRKELGIPTLFNLTGPLCNPASATHHVLGVGRHDMIQPVSEALAELGMTRAFVVHGEPGFDEATPCGAVTLVEVTPGEVHDRQLLDPTSLGLPPTPVEDVAPVPAAKSIQALEAVLMGRGPVGIRRIVQLNVGLGLSLVHGTDLADGVQEAHELLQAGVGKDKWHAMVRAARRSDE